MAVTFDYASWAAMYPALASSVAEPTATVWAQVAAQYIGRVLCDPCTDDATKNLYLNMATAHLVALNVPINGVAPSSLVGRVSDASEGSVSVKTDYGTQSASAAWWLQTPYGAALWQLLAAYLQGFYAPGPQPYYESPVGYGRDGGIWMGAGTGRGQW